ncbi:MAG: PCP reductase family protein, partial [Nitrospirales bacterium]
MDEVQATTYFASFTCTPCGKSVGVEGERKEVSSLLNQISWTDEAQHIIDRLPPYIAPLYQDDVEQYAKSTGNKLVTFDFLGEAKNQGTVSWSPETQRRLERVPPGIRAMARVELER